MTFFILLFFLILSGVWGFFIEPNCIKVEKLFLKAKNLPLSFQGLKILHLSDIHFKKFDRKEKKVLEILNRLNPDFIFITGDIIDEKTRDFESCRKFLEELSRNRQGKIYGVYGNHEHRNKRFGTLADLLRENKIEILDNESKKIEKNGEFFYLIGVNDPYSGHDDIEKAMEGVENNSFKILLAHSPEIFRKAKDKNINLVLVGHTHGAQVNLPFLSYFILPLKYDKKYKRGLFLEKSTYLYVNRGIGETFLPIRLNAFPEITLIELKHD